MDEKFSLNKPYWQTSTEKFITKLVLFKSKTARLLKLCHQYKTPTVAKKHFKLVK